MRSPPRSPSARSPTGAKLIGHKVGLTSKAMQRSSQIDEPDYGHLLDDMMIADGAKVPHENYCLPRVEIELAFILGKPLKGPGVGLHRRVARHRIRRAGDRDRRCARCRTRARFSTPSSDNGAAAGIVIGGRPVGPLDVDLRWVGGIMYRNSEIEETGVAAGVLGHPALGVAWLANKLGQHGVTLEPGHLVLAGSFTRVVLRQEGRHAARRLRRARRHRRAVRLILGGDFTPLVPAKAAIAGGEDARKRADDGRLRMADQVRAEKTLGRGEAFKLADDRLAHLRGADDLGALRLDVGGAQAAWRASRRSPHRSGRPACPY